MTLRSFAGLVVVALAVATPGAWARPSKVPEPTPRLADGAWRDALRARPRLIGPREHLRALSRERPDAYRAITRMDDSLLARGVVHAVDGLPRDAIEPWLERARKRVAKGPTNVHQDSWLAMREVALTFDLFHDAIDEAERRAWVEFLNGHLGVFTQDEGAFHNSTLSKILTYLQAARATWGENPRAPAHTFLHVLFTDAPQPVRLLRGSGVRLKVGDVELRFDGRVGGTVEAGGRKVKLEPRVRPGRFED